MLQVMLILLFNSNWRHCPVGNTLQVGNTDTSGNVKITGEIYVDDPQLGNILPTKLIQLQWILF